MTAPIVLPADVYDTLELVALEFGGIEGHGTVEGPSYEDYVPLCPHAMAGFACDVYPWTQGNEMSTALSVAGIGCMDREVLAIRKRIPFRSWCRRLNVVRGE